MLQRLKLKTDDDGNVIVVQIDGKDIHDLTRITIDVGVNELPMVRMNRLMNLDLDLAFDTDNNDTDE